MNDLSKIIDFNTHINSKSIGFLQGPLGEFFKNISNKFEKEENSTCYHFIFNGGDEYYSNAKMRIYCKESTVDNNKLIISKIQSLKITTIFLLGDERNIHKDIIKWCNIHNIKVFVFEEGYFRPNYITLEEIGVNANSILFNNIDFNNIDLVEEKKVYLTPKKISNRYNTMAKYAITYFVLLNIGKFKFKKYKHHRSTSLIYETISGIRNFYRKHTKSITEQKFLQIITNDISGNFIFFPLQVKDDFQIKTHSPFNNTYESIEHVLKLYKEFKCEEYLVIKHHLMDRGKMDYSLFIKDKILELNINSSKVIYFFDVHLPTCLEHCKKCITVNSTVGLMSLNLNKPTLTLGQCNYDIINITENKKDFFNNDFKLDLKKFKKFKLYLINHTQINGSFYF